MKYDPFLRTMSESALRRKADRLGYRLTKDRSTGWRLVDHETNTVAFGAAGSGLGAEVSLDAIQVWLNSESPHRRRKRQAAALRRGPDPVGK